MSAATALARGRAAAERLLVDQCEITRVVGPPGPIDPETGLREPPPTETVYSGRCKVQTYEPHESKPESGGHVFTVQRYYVHIPVGAGPIQVDDRVTITSATADPGLAGRTYRIAGLMHKSMATAQRLLVDEVTG